MSRRARAPKRHIEPDPRYQNLVLAKFINHIMLDGKKTVAQAIVYGALEIIKEKGTKDPIRVFDAAMRNVSPVLEIKARRIGGANYQIPVEVRGSRRETLAMRWMIEAARAKKGMPMSQRLAEELLDAANNAGGAIKKKQDVQKMAESNKAFSHFA